MSGKRGGKREGSGRKRKWYGDSVAMRVPAIYKDAISYCIENEIELSIDFVLNQVEKVHKQISKIEKRTESNRKSTKTKHSPELIKAALALHEQGLKGKALLTELEKRGFDNLPSASNLARTLKKWQDLKI